MIRYQRVGTTKQATTENAEGAERGAVGREENRVWGTMGTAVRPEVEPYLLVR
jgi:hypothetical protein